MSVRSMSAAVAILALLPCPVLSGANELDEPSSDVLAAAQWDRLDASLNRALRWLSKQQEPDGSFAAPAAGQPAITAFGVMAFLSAGHRPGHGPYGHQIDRAINFVLSCQKRDGLLCRNVPESKLMSYHASHTATYNHGIAGVMLCEVYGMMETDVNRRIANAIDKGLAFTARIQDRPRKRSIDHGAWRYFHTKPVVDADLSATSWQLMFYRSARNAGFEVPSERIDRAMRFVVACFDTREHAFRYQPGESNDRQESKRAMSGAGILALTHGGRFDHEMARQAGDWLLAHPCRDYNGVEGDENFHYGLFYSVPAMYMLGGRHWQQFFPTTVDTMLRHQNTDGSWPPESGVNTRYGNTYTTALVITALNTPNQLLPIMQR